MNAACPTAPPHSARRSAFARPSNATLLQRLLPCLLFALLPGATLAQQPTAPVEATVRNFLLAESAGLPGTVDVEVGAFDPGNLLPPCDTLEAFLPGATRAWGQINVGVRCLGPVPWTAYLPARVAVHLDYLVTRRPLRAGQLIGPDDLRVEHGDVTRLHSGVLNDPVDAVGRHARFAVAQDNPLRRDMLRLPPVIQSGQNVRVIGSGRGFSVMNEGRAMNRAGEGEQVRVRLGNGQVVTGVARHDGTVELRF